MRFAIHILTITFMSLPGVLLSKTAKMTDQEQIVFEAVLYWYENYRNPEHAYNWVENDEYVTPAIKQKLKKKIKEFKEEDEGAFFFVDITDVQIPVEGFAYIEIVSGDPFYRYKYVHVLERKESWEVIDSYNLADGLLETIQTTFDWDRYYEDLKIERSNKSVGQIPSIKDARD